MYTYTPTHTHTELLKEACNYECCLCFFCVSENFFTQESAKLVKCKFVYQTEQHMDFCFMFEI